MDPQGTVLPQDVGQDVGQEPIPEYTPPRRNITPFIIIGVVFAILLVVTGIVFLLVRTRISSTQPSNNTSTLTPLPTPSSYQLVKQDIQEQEAKLNEIGNDLRELETVFSYESVNFSDVLTPPPAQTPEWEVQKTEIAKARAELEIDRRIATLDKLGPKIESLEKLSSASKSQLGSEVDSEIASLSSLKGRIMAQNNFSALTVEINTLSQSFKNYQVLVPKALIVAIADKINAFGSSFTSIANKLAQKTGELHALEKDVTDVQKTLGHMLFVLGDAANKGESAAVAVLPLSSSDYPKNRSVLVDAKDNLQASHKNLSLAVSDAKSILNTLIAVESGKAPSRNFFQLFPLFRL